MSMRRSFLIDVAAVAALVADVAAMRTPRFAAVREPIVARWQSRIAATCTGLETQANND
jgi:hypothetical protein